MISILTSESSILQVSPCSDRQITYYLEQGKNYQTLKESLNKDFQQFRQAQGKAFVDKCFKLSQKWASLEEEVQKALLAFEFPHYLSLASAVALLQVPGKLIEQCLTQLRSLHEHQGYLDSSNISKVAKLFHVTPKRYLVLEEEMTLEYWQIVAKKYKLKNPKDLAVIQQKAQEMALHETVFTDHAVKALLELGYDPLLVLPKLKKKYTERDLDTVVEKAVEPLKQENTTLKERIQELEELKYDQAVNLNQQLTQVEPYIQTEEQFVQDSELQVLHSVIEPDEVIPTTPKIDDSETLPQITSLKDLKDFKVIINHNGVEKQGMFSCQNGTGHTGQVKTLPDQKIYTKEFSEIQLEYPCGSEQYQVLTDLIEEHNWIVEERSAEQIRLEIEEKKAQRDVKTSSKGFGFSSKNQSSLSHKSLNTKGFVPNLMGKKAGAR